MHHTEDIPRKLTDFFDNTNFPKRLKTHSTFLCRKDGVILYSKINDLKTSDTASIGALVGGVWQASEALASFIPETKSSQEFRLSFDTSSHGIYILPVSLGGDYYYLGVIYREEVNPGQMKLNLRTIKEKLEDSLSKINFKEGQKLAEKSEYLFSDISDKEMDKIFAFAGG